MSVTTIIMISIAIAAIIQKFSFATAVGIPAQLTLISEYERAKESLRAFNLLPQRPIPSNVRETSEGIFDGEGSLLEIRGTPKYASPISWDMRDERKPLLSTPSTPKSRQSPITPPNVMRLDQSGFYPIAEYPNEERFPGDLRFVTASIYSYKPNHEVPVLHNGDETWNLVEHITFTGLHCKLFHNRNCNELIIAFRGTDDKVFEHLVADARLAIHQLPMTEIEKFVQELSKNKLFKSANSIYFTGHSLGATIATAVALDPRIVDYVSGLIVFDSPGVPNSYGPKLQELFEPQLHFKTRLYFIAPNLINTLNEHQFGTKIVMTSEALKQPRTADTAHNIISWAMILYRALSLDAMGLAMEVFANRAHENIVNLYTLHVMKYFEDGFSIMEQFPQRCNIVDHWPTAMQFRTWFVSRITVDIALDEQMKQAGIAVTDIEDLKLLKGPILIRQPQQTHKRMYFFGPKLNYYLFPGHVWYKYKRVHRQQESIEIGRDIISETESESESVGNGDSEYEWLWSPYEPTADNHCWMSISDIKLDRRRCKGFFVKRTSWMYSHFLDKENEKIRINLQTENPVPSVLAEHRKIVAVENGELENTSVSEGFLDKAKRLWNRLFSKQDGDEQPAPSNTMDGMETETPGCFTAFKRRFFPRKSD